MVWAYKFDDGSGFTLRSVAIWNALVLRSTGLFSEGIGRFAGMMGSARGGGTRLPAPVLSRCSGRGPMSCRRSSRAATLSTSLACAG